MEMVPWKPRKKSSCRMTRTFNSKVDVHCHLVAIQDKIPRTVPDWN